jgi:Mrp family chromosome partitioning ATPase
MLKALQEIEARSPQPQRAESPPGEEPNSETPLPRVEMSPGEGESAPSETVVDGTAVETVLARVEAVAATAANLSAYEDDGVYAELADKILSRLAGERPVSLMFTSPGDGDGKTETLVALAAALVKRITGKVLLVDGNLHRPGLARCLGVDAARGLSDVLIGEATWQQVVCRTDMPRVSVLPGVRLAARDGWPPERLNLGPLLAELGREYRLVLIDTASLAHTEVAPVARYCDGTYLIVRLGRATRRAVRDAVKVIQDCRGRVLGSVVIGG